MLVNPLRSRIARVRDDERGIVVVWVALLMVVLLGFAALAIDGANLRHIKEREQKAADAAALAGVIHLPDDPAAAQAAAQDIASRNTFTDDGATTSVNIDPSSNTLKVTVTRTVTNFFAGVLGIDSSTVSATATAAYERPASVATPVDLVLIIDRTSSMTSTDLANAKNAAKALLRSLDPAIHHVALGVLGPSQTASSCSGAYGRSGPLPGGVWLASPYPAAPLMSDYKNSDNSLNGGSQIVRTIDCLNTSSVGTDLTTPVREATSYLAANARAGARRGIILMTDGQPNTTSNPCQDAEQQATLTKQAGIEMVTIGFGVNRGAVDCPDVAGAYSSRPPVTRLLASMASPIDGVPATDQCRTDPAIENSDNDNFFCLPRDEDLSRVFVDAASAFTGANRPRLVQ